MKSWRACSIDVARPEGALPAPGSFFPRSRSSLEHKWTSFKSTAMSSEPQSDASAAESVGEASCGVLAQPPPPPPLAMLLPLMLRPPSPPLRR